MTSSKRLGARLPSEAATPSGPRAFRAVTSNWRPSPSALKMEILSPIKGGLANGLELSTLARVSQ